MEIKNLPFALRLLRQQAKLTQQQVADAIRRAGIAKTTASMVSLWESGEQSPTVESLAGFLGGLGMNFHQLQDALEAIASGKAAGKTARETLLEFRRQGLQQVAVDSDLARRVAELEAAVYGRTLSRAGES